MGLSLWSKANLDAGDWFWLTDADTKFHHCLNSEFHPWMLYVPYRPGRTVFIHVCPRSTAPIRPNQRAIKSRPHAHGCDLNMEAHLKPQEYRQGITDWLDRGRYICSEPDASLVNNVALAIDRIC